MSKQTAERSKQEQEAFIAVPVSLSQEPEIQDEERLLCSWSVCGENCLLAILPCLLFVQFGVAYLTESPPQIHWMVVNVGIISFIATTIIFRRAFSEPESLVALIPEVLIDVILGLILFEKTENAAYLMFLSVIGMGAVATGKMLFCGPNKQNIDDDSLIPRGLFIA